MIRILEDSIGLAGGPDLLSSWVILPIAQVLGKRILRFTSAVGAAYPTAFGTARMICHQDFGEIVAQQRRASQSGGLQLSLVVGCAQRQRTPRTPRATARTEGSAHDGCGSASVAFAPAGRPRAGLGTFVAADVARVPWFLGGGADVVADHRRARLPACRQGVRERALSRLDLLHVTRGARRAGGGRPPPRHLRLPSGVASRVGAGAGCPRRSGRYPGGAGGGVGHRT